MNCSEKARAAERSTTVGSVADDILSNKNSCVRMSYFCRVCKVPYTRFGALQRHQLLVHRIWQFRSGEFADWTDQEIDERIAAVRTIVHNARVRHRDAKRAGQASGTLSPSAAVPPEFSAAQSSSTVASDVPCGVRCAFVGRVSPNDDQRHRGYYPPDVESNEVPELSASVEREGDRTLFAEALSSAATVTPPS